MSRTSRPSWSSPPGSCARRATLAERVNELRPERRVLYMSGYSERVLSLQGVLDEGVALIEKPFNRRTLLEKVHAALTTPRTAPPNHHDP